MKVISDVGLGAYIVGGVRRDDRHVERDVAPRDQVRDGDVRWQQVEAAADRLLVATAARRSAFIPSGIWT